MNKYTITSVFGIIGVLSWSLTILLREVTLSGNDTIKFILGIMPNISACWLFICVGEVIVNKMNNNFTFKVASIISGVIFLLAIISELIHDIFLNSPFDMNDIIATILAITLYLISFYITKYKVKINEQS